MTKSLQKSAKRLSLLKLPHPGILDPEGFDKHFDLRCYQPSRSLRPFVVHIWTQRRRLTDSVYESIEVLSGPNMYLFITNKQAFIHGITPQRFRYDAQADQVIAGIKFQPGGLYAFYGKPLRDLAGKTVPASDVFPEIDDRFIKKLLESDDSDIFSTLEDLLKKRQPSYNHMHTVNKVMHSINEGGLHTVAEIAHNIGRSERSLQLLFRNQVGVPLKWVLTRKRLLHTVENVHTQDNLSWTEAAAEQGYSSQSHFTREFKSAVGLSPSQYLKSVYNSKK